MKKYDFFCSEWNVKLVHAKYLFIFKAGNLKNNSYFSLLKRKKSAFCDQICTRKSWQTGLNWSKLGKNKIVKSTRHIYKKWNLRKTAHTLTIHSQTKLKETQCCRFICTANCVFLFSCKKVPLLFPRGVRGKGGAASQTPNPTIPRTSNRRDEWQHHKQRNKGPPFHIFGCVPLLTGKTCLQWQ